MKQLGWLGITCSLVAISAGACGGDDLTCADGTHEVGGECVAQGSPVTCGDGTILVGDTCLPGESPEGTALTFTSATSPTPYPGGGLLELEGSGFRAANAGDLALTVGGVVTPVFATSDTTAVATLPAASAGDVELVLSNTNGSATKSFQYQGILAAEGTSDDSSLFLVDPRNGASVSLGLIGFLPEGETEPLRYSIGGMAFASDGTLYAISTGSPSMLLTIDPATTEATEIGPLVDGDMSTHGHINDITFVGGQLYGWSRDGDRLVAIDSATAAVTTITMTGDYEGGASGLVESAGNLFTLSQADGTPISYTTAGVGTSGTAFTNPDTSARIMALARLDANTLVATSRSSEFIYFDLVTNSSTVKGILSTRFDSIVVPSGFTFEKIATAGVVAPGVDLQALIPATARASANASTMHKQAMQAASVWGANAPRGASMPLRSFAHSRGYGSQSLRVTEANGSSQLIPVAAQHGLALRANRRGHIKLVDTATGRPVARDVAAIEVVR